jgi:uncharacterized protein
MRLLIGVIAAAALMSVANAPAKAASFSCMERDGKTAAEVRVCESWWLGGLDERMDSWYRRALERARYFDQTSQVKGEQRAWIAARNACGAKFFCIRRAYVERIRELKSYVEHV